jgi:mannose-6-phosphate isomerase-like protein (cupin superfamily)
MKKLSLTETLKQLPFPATDKWPQGVWHSLVLRHGTMSAGIFAPKGQDFQGPHPQDEVYFVASGKGEIIVDGERTTCQIGDAVFVPANAVHHFENFSDDFVTWVVFWGPEGGERVGE